MSGYVYRGAKREGLPDLETVNAAIVKARPPGAGPVVLPHGDVRHGTSIGFRDHLQHGEQPCDRCQYAEDARERRMGPGRTKAEAQRQRRDRERRAKTAGDAA
jgi:hypothetical protein